jgi:hypothetical protein
MERPTFQVWQTLLILLYKSLKTKDPAMPCCKGKVSVYLEPIIPRQAFPSPAVLRSIP